LVGVVACALTEASGILDDDRFAPVLVDALRPMSGRLIAGVTSGAASLGPADRYLGILATLEHNWEEAEAAFQAALQLEERLPSPPFVARTQYWYARMLQRRDAPGDGEQAAH